MDQGPPAAGAARALTAREPVPRHLDPPRLPVGLPRGRQGAGGGASRTGSSTSPSARPVDPVPAVVRAALAGRPRTCRATRRRTARPSCATAIAGSLARRSGHRVDPRDVLPTIGSKEFVAWLPTLLGLTAGDLVVIPEVAYPTYEVGALLAGAEFVRTDGLSRWAPAAPALIWLNSPSNPTGRVLPVEHLRKVVAWARERGRGRGVRRVLPGAVGCRRTRPSILHPDVCDGDHDRPARGALDVQVVEPRRVPRRFRDRRPRAWSAALLEVRKHAGMMVPRAGAGGDGRRRSATTPTWWPRRRSTPRRGRAAGGAGGVRASRSSTPRPGSTCGRPRASRAARPSDGSRSGASSWRRVSSTARPGAPRPRGGDGDGRADRGGRDRLGVADRGASCGGPRPLSAGGPVRAPDVRCGRRAGRARGGDVGAWHAPCAGRDAGAGRAVRPALVLLGVLALAVNLRAALAAYPPLLETVRDELGISAGAAGLVQAGAVLMMAAGSFVGPALGGRFGRKPALGGAVGLVALGSAVRGWARAAGADRREPPGRPRDRRGGRAAHRGGQEPPRLPRGRGDRRLRGGHDDRRDGVQRRWPCRSPSLLGGWSFSLAVWTVPAVLAVAVWTPIARRIGRPDTAEPRTGLPWRTGFARLVAGYQAGTSLMFYGWLSGSPRTTRARAGVRSGRACCSRCGASPRSRRRCSPRRWPSGAGVAVLGGPHARVRADRHARCAAPAQPPVGPWLWAALMGIGVGAGFPLGLTVIAWRTPDAATSAATSGLRSVSATPSPGSARC